MTTVTVKYGVEARTTQVECGTTIGQLVKNPTNQAALGYGNNVDALINGVSMPMEAIVPDGATVVLETACNSKAKS